jgi:hypothetical protein
MKTVLFSGFKKPYKKSSLFMNSILWNRKMRVEKQTKLDSKKKLVYAQKPRLKILFKNSIFGSGRLDSVAGSSYLEKEQFDVVHGEDGSTIVHVLLQVLIEVAIMEINIKVPNPKCCLYWCFIDWRDSQSCWYFRPSFEN